MSYYSEQHIRLNKTTGKWYEMSSTGYEANTYQTTGYDDYQPITISVLKVFDNIDVACTILTGEGKHFNKAIAIKLGSARLENI